MESLFHYGTSRHSGRYPYGSGEDPNQHGTDFLSEYRKLHEQGLSDKDIAKGLGLSTSELRAKRSVESDAERGYNIARATKLKDNGYSNVKIGEMMGGASESTVRSWLKQSQTDRVNATKNAADILKKNVDEKGFIDVGIGVEREMNISKTKLDTAISMLKDQGYEAHTFKLEQATNPGQYTTIKVLAPPGTTWKDVIQNKDKIQTINEYSPDGGKTFQAFEYPKSISSNRIKIRYNEEGGNQKDGVIELRRGVDDISLGKASYAQVRIAVDGTHYLKGMAMYSDDLPKGVDVVFNTNKSVGTDKKKVFKAMQPDMTDPKAKAILDMKLSKEKTEDLLKQGVVDGSIKPDQDNPFGAAIKAGGQRRYDDPKGDYTDPVTGKKQSLSVINKLREEGDWDEYSKNLSSQMLSKQKKSLVDKQLELSLAERKEEFDLINSLNNPAIKQKLLESFADDCDAGAEHLKAAALPRQASKVILPISSLKDTEIYAPTFNNGESVVLIRFPHGGTFEIPELVVNNKQPKAKAILDNAVDAVGINSKVAARLSGADFDGDTVIVIPVNSHVKVTTSKPLEGLKGFDPKDSYPGYDGMKKMSSRQKGLEMGNISNLITDMTLKGASSDELTRAVRHSMVVIDAEKHGLDYKRSESDHGIKALKTTYQGKANAGASTLISKASSEARVNERKRFVYKIDPKTGEKIYFETGRTYIDKNGKERPAQDKITKMAREKDARALSSGTIIEEAYANYANSLKAMSNRARKEILSIKPIQTSLSAKETYRHEIASLDAKLNVALKNAPKERKAQLLASTQMEIKKSANPNMDKDEIKKASAQALATARVRVGAGKKDVYITVNDREWEAIQSGAISSNKLSKILNNTDLDTIRQRATPREQLSVNPAKADRMRAMAKSGYTIAEIADQLGYSSSVVSKSLKE